VSRLSARACVISGDMKRRFALLLALAACTENAATSPGGPDAGVAGKHKVIVFVWDGLRPDSVTQTDTPNLAQLATEGATFTDNHSTYPTFTMMNAASFATGARPAQTGFYGNTFWQPTVTGKDSTGAVVDFNQPLFSEDYAILADVDAAYGGKLLLVGSLFAAAQTAGLSTAAVGKSGPAYLQDAHRGGVILDEKMAWPLSFAKELQAAGKPLPRMTPVLYGDQLTLNQGDMNPTGAAAKVTLADKATSDPTDASGSPNSAANAYLMGLYLEHILGPKQPDLTVIWLRSPDSTEHAYGPGSANYRDALHAQDALLGQLRDKIAMANLESSIDIIVVSDHGHSTVSGPLDLFPLRAVSGGAMGAIDANGFAVSGDVRMADLLVRAGFAAFDGVGCTLDPVMAGIRADGTSLYPTLVDDNGDPDKCGTAGKGKSYNTRRFPVVPPLAAKAIVVAANGGSDYLYVPDHDADTVAAVVRFLQSREEVGAIFVGRRYGDLPGTMPLDAVELEGTHGRGPDIIFGYTWDATAKVQGLPGIEFESAQGNRGMHGSFGPTDVHNTLIAAGPDFKAGFKDALPSANVDVAPTVARLLGLALPGAVGRPLLEALSSGGAASADYQVAPGKLGPKASATGLTMKLPTDPDGKAIDSGKSSYTFELATKTLSYQGKTWTYFDSAKAVRQ
jgi:arylsulfatase A-like enzyme